MSHLRFHLAALVVAAASTIASLAPAAPEGQPVKDPNRLVLPAGDPTGGREAFLGLKCTACHAVTGEAGMPAPVGANPGPKLGRAHASQPVERLVSSIVAPSHWVAPEARERSDGPLSPMGDFSQSMTVRQLIDLVAFIQSIDSKPPQGTAMH
jgi:mono/diheme cytochrome c family protein